ncbi:hypothetical protein CPB84DRAFT_1751076 [Gymnopilus junonius]|uniref:C3H1-type domain-containing protein n=1 Tax=Gymnopilus junonius TaxID=109634 RepID=A0A9P5TIY0_GYMJU|nr:hypothetical protein CPB84DRAFT_1751076 [Gymnopilus junonius]
MPTDTAPTTIWIAIGKENGTETLTELTEAGVKAEAICCSKSWRLHSWRILPFLSLNARAWAEETCTWFVKGNCKFGHKCALAHVLPGQSMAMDRKNKKAAQAAAAAASNASGDKGAKSSRGGKREPTLSSNGVSSRLPLLAGGATAPTRLVNSGSSGTSPSGRPPMNLSLKATISPSAPAPPLKDTDFAAFASLEEMEGVHQPSTPKNLPRHADLDEASKSASPNAETSSPSQYQTTANTNVVPVSAPRPPANTAANDFGPIGSPPNYRPGQPISPSRVNGGAFTPGTSPRGQTHINGVNMSSSPSNNAGLPSSPFSAPGNQNIFHPSSYNTAGIAASLGSGLAMMGGRRGWGDSDAGSPNVGANSFSGLLNSQLSSSVSQQRSAGMNGFGSRGEYDISIEYDEFTGTRTTRKSSVAAEIAVEEEDLEIFCRAQRSRRMSRSNSGQRPGISHLTSALANAAATEATNDLGTGAGAGNGVGNGTSGLGHRYSRSVPAPSLLGDIKSIWADASTAMPSSPPTHRGTPSASYASRFDQYSNSLHPGDDGLSMSMGSAGTPSSLGMMSPSNASAAFLPGLHHHYLNAKAKQAQAQQAQLGHGGIGRQLRGASNPLFPGATTGTTNNNSIASNYLQPLGGLGLPSSASTSGFHTHTHGNTQTTYRTTPSPFDLTQTLHQNQNPQTARPIPSNLTSQVEDPLLAPHLLSPSARALQQHAPGQSLPQGLAAGYSRIHALPPLTNIASSPTSGSFIPGSSPGAGIAAGNNGITTINEAP